MCLVNFLIISMAVWYFPRRPFSNGYAYALLDATAPANIQYN